MVFTSAVQLAKRAGLDQYWKKRRIFRLSAHYYGRARNCYVLAIRAVHRSLAFATKARKFKKEDMAQLWETRIAAGSEQHGVKYPHLREGLHRCNIHLNRKTLADLAIWEPYTFRVG
ncbi:unnamed protein product [Nesidiocoris tenuis]|uniref:Large ribosomal subunit protein bL20m n=1 Tax=Nesidiocoris tenuis TaxID=355587 RepID=A0A6H5FZS0_9HEMI|nr:unnamed protein product [Nesidiocoris tenuis]